MLQILPKSLTSIAERRRSGAWLPKLVVWLVSLAPLAAAAQTPGLIFKTATVGTPGRAVLDPDGDGYVSAKQSGVQKGFTSDDVVQSEIPYKYIPQFSTSGEPSKDLRVGPKTKFTDFEDTGTFGRAVGFYVDTVKKANNFMFRFRLGGSAPNSKSYSVAIDTDGKFGFTGTNADPDAVAGNPGFEIEINLATNFGVRLYNINGSATPIGTAVASPVSSINNALVQLPYDSYAQKAVAYTTNDGDLDVFYDFYIPMSVIQQYFGNQTFFGTSGTSTAFSLSTPLRMVANTMIAPKSVTQYQNISDIGGVDDTQYANTDYAFSTIITQTTTVSGNALPSGNSIQVRSLAPTVTSPILTSAGSVGGTSTETAGSTITVYVNGSSIGTTTVLSNGTWSLTGLASTVLPSGALVKATAQNTGASETVSDFSNEVKVGGTAACTTTAAPVTTGTDCATGSGIYLGPGAVAAGATVTLLFLDGTTVPATGGNRALNSNPVTAAADGSVSINGKGGNSSGAGVCNNGQSSGIAGTYIVSVLPSGASCANTSKQICIGTTTEATPVLTTTLPVTASTTTISGTVGTTNATKIMLFTDGVLTSTITNNNNSTAFSFTGLSLTSGRTLTIKAYRENTSCLSNALTINVVTPRTVIPPIVTSPILVGATSIKGTSSEAAGSIITVYSRTTNSAVTNNTSLGTTTVASDGSWTLPVLSTQTPASTTISATVTVADYGTSALSNTVDIKTRTAAPVITGSYSETTASTDVKGTGTPGATITLYIDGGDAIGTATVDGTGNWTISVSVDMLRPTVPILYAGGQLTATATAGSQLTSAESTPVAVGCATIGAANAMSPATTTVCSGNTITYSIASPTAGVVYTLQDVTASTSAGKTIYTGNSAVGEGTSLSLTTSTLTAAGTSTYRFVATSIGATTCSVTSTTSATGTVIATPSTSLAVGSLADEVRNNGGTRITVGSSETGVIYQLVNKDTGSDVTNSFTNGTGSAISLSTGPMTKTTTYGVRATRKDVTSGVSCPTTLTASKQVVVNSSLPVELTRFTAQAQGRGALLRWETASEQNSAHFTIERSATGTDFQAIGQLPAQGVSSKAVAYTFTDEKAGLAGAPLYYRLRQVDLDGTSSLSPVRTVHFEAASVAHLGLYPNPAAATLTLDLGALPAGTYAVQVLNVRGQVVLSTSLEAGRAHELALAGLPAGAYALRVRGAGTSLSRSFVKLP